MGYNTSRNSVVKVKPHLDALVKSDKSVAFASNDPLALAQNLRQGIKAAQVHRDEFGIYANLLEEYKLRALPKEKKVIARKIEKDPLFLLPVEVDDNDEDDDKIEVTSFTNVPPKEDGGPKVTDVIPIGLDNNKKLSFEEASSLIDILGTILANIDAYELSFPRAILSNEDKTKLWGWTKENTEWKLIDSGENGIVLTKEDVPFEITWQPEE